MKVLQLCVKPEVRYFGLGHLFELGLKTATSIGAEVSQAYLEAHEDNLTGLPSDSIKHFQLRKHALKINSKSAVTALKNYCLSENFDVIITHQYKAYRLLQLALHKQKQPLCLSVIHGLGVFSRLRRRFGTLGLTNKPGWHFVAISAAVKKDLEQNLWGVSKNRIHLLPNALDREYVEQRQLPKLQARDFLGLSSDDFIFGALGRLVPKKGHLTLLRAFKKVASLYPSAKCVIIGDGRLENDIKAAIKDLQLDNNVKITGYVPDAFAYVTAFDIFVMPSLDEGFGIALLEAMSAKLPIIATDAGGIPEVMGNEPLVDAGHAEALAEAMIKKMNTSEAERLEEGERHYRRLCGHFTSQVYQSRLSELLLMASEKKKAVEVV